MPPAWANGHWNGLQCRNGGPGFWERANVGADETRVQVQSAALMDGSVAPHPAASPMPILLSANWNLENLSSGLKSMAYDIRKGGMYNGHF